MGNYTAINEFKKGHQPHAYVIKKDDGTIVADTTSILSNLLNVNQSTNLEGSEIYTVEPDIPEPSLVEVQLVIDNLKNHKAPGVDHIPSELIRMEYDLLPQLYAF